MRSRMRRATRTRDIVIFWTLVLASALILAGLAFLAGKYWVGGLLANSDSSQKAPTVAVKTPDELQEEDLKNQQLTEPPNKASVKMQERAPSEGEKSEIEQTYPQDGADLNKTGAGAGNDSSTGSDNKPLPGEGKSDGSKRFIVSAGSFSTAANADREMSDLLDRGYSPFIVKVEKDGKTYHRVSIGPYATREEAERVRDDLSAAGKAATVTTH